MAEARCLFLTPGGPDAAVLGTNWFSSYMRQALNSVTKLFTPKHTHTNHWHEIHESQKATAAVIQAQGLLLFP